jgi:hypothetical protein
VILKHNIQCTPWVIAFRQKAINQFFTQGSGATCPSYEVLHSKLCVNGTPVILTTIQFENGEQLVHIFSEFYLILLVQIQWPAYTRSCSNCDINTSAHECLWLFWYLVSVRSVAKVRVEDNLIMSVRTIAFQVIIERSRGSSPTTNLRTWDHTPSAPTNSFAFTALFPMLLGPPSPCSSCTSKCASTPPYKVTS